NTATALAPAAAPNSITLGIHGLPSLRRPAPLHQAFVEPIGIDGAWPHAVAGGRLRHIAECVEGGVWRSLVLLQPVLRRIEARPSEHARRQVDLFPAGIVGRVAQLL